MQPIPQLLHGPYLSPDLHVGSTAFCLLRQCEVVITSWSIAPIYWPRSKVASHRGGSELLLAGNLVRGLRCESAHGIKYWWGVSDHTVWSWGKALGIGRMDPEGNRILI